MIKPGIPLNEKQRLKSLKDLNIIDSLPEDNYDNITKLASFICDTPIALISFIGEDYQYFKSKVGADLKANKRELSFCGHAILEPDTLFEVSNSAIDDRFKDNPFAIADNNAVRFYAGVPIKDKGGMALGTLCVIDSKEKHLNEDQKFALKALAEQVESLLELRRKNRFLEIIQQDLIETNNVLKDFSGTVSHDLKMPLANIILTADILKTRYGKELDEKGIEYLDYLKQSGLKLNDYITGLLEHYETNSINLETVEEFQFNDLIENITDLLQISDDCELITPDRNFTIVTNNAALEQIFMNLISNSLKYNEKDKIEIKIDCTIEDDVYRFSITDNGIGIPADKKEEIFDLFTTLSVPDRRGKHGNGIGLSTVKKLITELGGTINLESQLGKGTQFNFTIERP